MWAAALYLTRFMQHAAYNLTFGVKTPEHNDTKAIHGDPDYSAVVCILKTDQGAVGHGMTFTLGRGNEIVKSAVESFTPFVIGSDIKEVVYSVLEITTLIA